MYKKFIISDINLFENVHILFSFCILLLGVYTSSCKNWMTLPHACNFTESAFIPVCNFLCLIWTSKTIIFCAQVVGVWKAYVSPETDAVLIWLCREFQVWFPCSNTKPVLKHPVAKPIHLEYWSGLSACCSKLHYRSPELLDKPELENWGLNSPLSTTLIAETSSTIWTCKQQDSCQSGKGVCIFHCQLVSCIARDFFSLNYQDGEENKTGFFSSKWYNRSVTRVIWWLYYYKVKQNTSFSVLANIFHRYKICTDLW